MFEKSSKKLEKDKCEIQNFLIFFKVKHDKSSKLKTLK